MVTILTTYNTYYYTVTTDLYFLHQLYWRKKSLFICVFSRLRLSQNFAYFFCVWDGLYFPRISPKSLNIQQRQKWQVLSTRDFPCIKCKRLDTLFSQCPHFPVFSPFLFLLLVIFYRLYFSYISVILHTFLFRYKNM